jgi:hypothetical protein
VLPNGEHRGQESRGRVAFFDPNVSKSHSETGFSDRGERRPCFDAIDGRAEDSDLIGEVYARHSV